jgi:hypothetical protein
LLGLLACSSSATIDSGSGDGGGAGAPALPPCDEPAPSNPTFGCLDDPHWACPALPSPCAAASLFEDLLTGDRQVNNVGAVRCVAEQLRDRAAVTLTIETVQPLPSGPSRSVIYIVDGGHAGSWDTREGDLGAYCSTRRRQILQPAAYFDGCLAEADPVAMHACISDWSVGCAEVAADCP